MRISPAAPLAVALAATILGAQTPAAMDSVPALDQERLLRNISVLAADSMEGRGVGTPGGARARAFLQSEFARIGLTPAGRGYSVEFTAQARIRERRPNERPPCPRSRGGFTPVPTGNCDPFPPQFPVVSGVNLIGVVRGTLHPDRYIVVSAHYDHVGIRNGDIYNGADDNASGSAAILAIAEWTVKHPPLNSVVFAWFDGEEAGLLGSAAFVRSPAVPLGKIVADVNADMVSRSARGELFAAGARWHPVMQPFVDSVAAIRLVTVRQGHDGGGGDDDWTHRSDEGPFHDKGIPFIHFGVEEHPDYHKPTDDVERIQPEFYFLSACTIAEFVRRLDRGLGPVAAARK